MSSKINLQTCEYARKSSIFQDNQLIYATSIDYDPKAEISIQLFKKVQNKIHYAIHG